MNIPTSDLPRIVIIGAGFAGLQIAKKTRNDKYQLVLIDKHNYHTFQPLLYQVSSAGLEPDSIAYPIRKILAKKDNTYYRLANVTHIDTASQELHSDIGSLKYDKLVIATGATNNFFNNVSIEQQALPMKSLTDALNLRSKILGNFEKALNTNDLQEREALMSFVIVGAGPTGVELAGALAELKNKILPLDFPDLDLRIMKIHLIEAAPRVLAPMSNFSSEKAYTALKKLGVHIWTDTFVEGYENNIVTTNKEVSFPTDTLIWAAGVKGCHPEGLSEAVIGRGDRILCDDYCKVQGFENLYVAGDVGLIQSDTYPKGLPMLGSIAMQQGQYLAKAFNKEAQGKTTPPFRYNDKGTMATIGRNKAVAEIGKFKFKGAFAWLVWMFVHLMLLVGFRNRVVVLVNWIWNYFRYNNGLRLIVRPYKRNNE